jgi:predicted flap endonuclease-1-like 5' DNA nuclease
MTLESPALLIFILFLAAVAVLLVRQGRAKPDAKDSRPTVAAEPPAAAVVPPPPPTPAPASAPVVVAAPTTPATSQDDRPVTTLKGLGPKVAAQLGELGVATVGDLAALSDAAAADLDAQLGSFQGRMARDRWIEQARLLAAGDVAGFEAAFGKLGG